MTELSTLSSQLIAKPNWMAEVDWLSVSSMIGIPLLLALVSNWVRKAVGTTPSTGADFVLAGMAADIAVLVVLDGTPVAELSAKALRSILIAMLVVGFGLFVWLVKLQAISDDCARVDFANSKRHRSAKALVPARNLSRLEVGSSFVCSSVYIVVHLVTIMMISRGNQG